MKKHAILLSMILLFFSQQTLVYGKNVINEGFKIQGKVCDASNLGIPGASVLIKNTTIGNITDIDGNFSIIVPNKNSVLVFSFIGYTPKEVPVDKQKFITVTLVENSQELEEVVVVAYGTRTKASMTGALSSISNKALTTVPVASVTNLLAGALPGVSAVQTSGQPGHDGASIYVRGCGSLSNEAAKPLILVDGIERDFNQIDPNEIDQISVLKDASSTAVFGVRGANGVVLVTTRSGLAGKPSINVSTSFGLQEPISLVNQTDSYNYAKFWNIKKRQDGITNTRSYFTREQIEAYRTGSDPIMYPNTDWGDYMYNKVSLQSKNNVNISGGTDNLKYFVSLGYLYQNGILKQFNSLPYDNNYRYDRYNYRVNLDIKLTKTTNLKLGIGGNVGKSREPKVLIEGNKPWVYAQIWSLPLSSPGLVNGKRTIISGAMLPLEGEPIRDGLRAFYGNGYNEYYDMLLNTNIDINQKLDFITKGLSFGIKGAYDNNFKLNKYRAGSREYQQANYKSFLEDNTKPQTDPDYDKTIVYTTLGANTPLYYKEDYGRDRDWYLEARLNYERTFNNHKVSGLVLYNQSRDYYPAKQNGRSAGYQYIPRSYVGLVGRAVYSYKTKYIADVNLGYNGSENFAPGKTRYGLFPSFSAGWVVSSESFMQKQKVIDYLKIRASWGRVGSDIGTNSRFMYLPTVWNQSGEYSFGVNNPINSIAYGFGTPGNDLVSWETADKQNYGLDFKIFNNRLSLNADYFIEHRKDILITPHSVPSIIATPLPDLNLGKVDNHGYELQIEWADKIKSVNYYINANLSYAKNKIVFMDEVPNKYNYMNVTGGSTGRYTELYRFDRLYQKSDFIVDETGKQKLNPKLAQPYVNVYPGDAKYDDLNKDGVVNSEDREVAGYSARPEYTVGLNAGIEYKGISFSMQWTGAANVDKMIESSFRIPFTDCGRRGLLEYFVDECWTPDNQLNATLPRASDISQNWNSEKSTLWLRNSSYLRLKSVNIAYTMAKKPFLSKLGIKSLTINFSGYNLLTFSTLKIIDPEGQTTNTGEYPLTKLYNFGLTAIF